MKQLCLPLWTQNWAPFKQMLWYCRLITIINCYLVLQKIGSNAKVGFSKAMSNGWLKLDKTAEGGARVYRKVFMDTYMHTLCIHTHTHTRTHTQNIVNDILIEQVDSISDIVQEKLRAVAEGNSGITEEELKEYKKRKLITNM